MNAVWGITSSEIGAQLSGNQGPGDASQSIPGSAVEEEVAKLWRPEVRTIV